MSRSTAKSGQRSFPVRGALLLLVAIGIFGLASPTTATPLTGSGWFLYYTGFLPSPLGNVPGEFIAFGADNVLPNASGGTTGSATTTNLSTGIAIPAQTINPNPGPATPDSFYTAFQICTTACTPLGNNNPSNLKGPWTLTFHNNGTTPTNVSNTLSLTGPGEIGFPQNITLSGTSAAPTFSWNAPPGPTPDGYRILIMENDLKGPGNNGIVVAKNLTQSSYTVNPADFTVPGYQLKTNTTYTIALENLVTKDGSATNLSNSNLSASSHAYSSFQIQTGSIHPLVNLPTFTSVGDQIIYSFQMTVQPGITYYIDPAVATGYIYKTGSGDPNFGSVELPDIGNPHPYDLYLWNGSAFVFDTMLAANTVFDFAQGGVSEFEVLGIDPGLGLDPNNTTAFITALTFEGGGDFTGTMSPVTANASSVPEPGSLALLASGLFGFGLTRHRRRRSQQKLGNGLAEPAVNEKTCIAPCSLLRRDYH